MFETVRTVLCLAKYYFKSRPMLRKAWKKSEQERWQDLYEFQIPLSRDLMAATGSRIVYHGLENIPEKEPWELGYLMVGNHQSYLDIPTLMCIFDRPTGFVAKSELGKTIFVKDIIGANGSLLMVQQDIRQSVKVIRQTSEHLKKGLNMVIFPEGARSMTTNEMGEFKRGALKAAISVGAEIIPFRFDNLYAVLEGNGKLKVTPRQVDVYFGVPIPTAGLSKEEQWALADKVKETIINLK